MYVYVGRRSLCIAGWLKAAVAVVMMLSLDPKVMIAQATPASDLDAVIENAQKAGDMKAVRRATNLKFALGHTKPGDYRGLRCGKDSTAMVIDVGPAEDVGGKLLGKALEKYLPTLAAALASAPATAVAAFLTPTKIGTDSVEILNQSDSRSRSEVQGAARQMLQDTPPEIFATLGTQMITKVAGCSI
jgi:hypothetical protein